LHLSRPSFPVAHQGARCRVLLGGIQSYKLILVSPPCDPPASTAGRSFACRGHGFREADERAAHRQRRLRDLRGRVKAARAALAAHPEAQEAIQADWRRGATFHARFGITQEPFRYGVSTVQVATTEELGEPLRSPCDWLGEWRASSSEYRGSGLDAGVFVISLAELRCSVAGHLAA
jgi:hypothetical protein